MDEKETETETETKYDGEETRRKDGWLLCVVREN